MRLISFLLIALLPLTSLAQTYNYPNAPQGRDLSAQMTSFGIQALSPGTGTIGDGSILVIGDSITAQLFPAYSACGRNVLFFAVDGLEAHDVIPYINTLIASSLPRVVVVALGKNDMVDSRLGYWFWEEDYFYLTLDIEEASAAAGRRVYPVLMTILPPERVAPQPWNNPSLLAQYNNYVHATGRTLGLAVVDFSAGRMGKPSIVTDGPYLTPGFTTPGDGLFIHPIGVSNALLWSYYQEAIEIGLSQAGQDCQQGSFIPSIPAH